VKKKSRSVVWSAAIVTAFAAHDAAFAQSPGASSGSKWDVEVHAGVSSPHNPVDGSGSLPATGTLVQGELSASSFYLGDGARLFNENQRLAAGTQSAPLIVPLDAVLLSAMTTREAGSAVGVRLQRAIRNRFAVQADGDLSLDHLAFTSVALRAIEATRASYIPAVERALSVSPLTSSVTSVATISDRHFAPQVFATGAFVLKLRMSGKTIPYLAGGGGVVLNGGTSPSATLVGNYTLDKPAQLLGTDSVLITHDEKSFSGLGLGGGGFTRDLNAKWGIRVDAREYLYENSGTNAVNITPTLGFQSTGQPMPVVNVGTLKFAATTPLNGQSVVTSTTFTGSGLQGHLIVSAGLLVRF
jgi:hypothetical protein